ncbi:MAG TPA: cyanophycinase [Vicinamibacteria bacterium]|nr:cyanophycinase [Vicinamibacteria bacterium]
MRFIPRLCLWLALLPLSPLWAQEIGPKNGALVIVGGAMEDEGIARRFIDLAGGPEAPIVVIPTAGEGEEYDQYYSGARRWRELGVENITVLHTRDRNVANSDDFVRPIREARGVWFSGGRQWRLADAYLDTRTELELHGVLERGGVIGGTSAGATIQGSYLVRGDTKTNTIMMGDHVEGFAFLKNVAIDQHLLVRNRHFDLIPVIEKFPELLGIGIDEDTAIVVEGDSFEVIGQSLVAIYDSRRTLSDGGRFYFLRNGDTYDLKQRQARRRAFSEQPFEAVKEEPWPELR